MHAPLTFSAPPSFILAVKEAAHVNRMNVSAMIREAVSAYMQAMPRAPLDSEAERTAATPASPDPQD
jgi:hypothetical protein